MTELKTYRCDRCRKLIHSEYEPAKITEESAYERPRKYHLCADCETTFDMFIINVEEFDKLAEKILVEEVKRVEELRV